MRRSLISTLAVLLLAACGVFAAAQPAAPDPRNVDATQFGERVALGPDWLFAPGDNPAYAAPAFDDSKWQVMSVQKPLSTYGYKNPRVAWYRIHVHLRPEVHGIAAAVREVSGTYSVYANGICVGAEGPEQGEIQRVQSALVAFPIPDDLVAPRGDLVLAVRFVLNVAGAQGRGTSNPMDSDAHVYLMSRDAVAHEAGYVAVHKTLVNFLLACLGVIVAMVALALYLAMRHRKEYLAAAVYLFATSCVSAVLVWDNIRAFTISATWLQYFFTAVAHIALIEFIRLVLGQQRRPWLLALQTVVFVTAFGSPLASSGIGSHYFNFAMFFLPILTVDVLLAVMLLRAWMGGNHEARRLLVAVLVYSFADYWNFGRFMALFLGFTATLHDLPSFTIGSYEMSLYQLGTYVFSVAILLFLVRRTVRIAQNHARAAAELEAARTTQRLLLARASQLTPGFEVESVYHPASEVGGDFFFVACNPAGSLLAVVGDVSGKGLNAAMRVAMIIGVLRREDSREPGRVLGNLNQALLTRGEAGFTTGCCVRLEPDGRYTLANAGHINPYIDGREVETPPALPLGLAPDQHYDTVSGSLAAHQRIVLLSDGVVEARNAAGELLGFDRLAPLTRSAAHEIADTARKFGQEDDITVLTLACISPAKPALA